MNKKLNIISIDGAEGVGQTTQINLLFKHFKDLDIPVLVNTLDDSIPSAFAMIKQTNKFLQQNPNGIVLNDGSIARMIVIDMSKLTHNKTLIEKYRLIMNEHEYLSHQYGMGNILLVPDDIEFCKKRLIRRAKLKKEKTPNLNQLYHQMDIVRGMRFFNNHVISRDVNFNIIDISDDESMLQIHNKVLNLLKEIFDIKKSPHF